MDFCKYCHLKFAPLTRRHVTHDDVTQIQIYEIQFRQSVYVCAKIDWNQSLFNWQNGSYKTRVQSLWDFGNGTWLNYSKNHNKSKQCLIKIKLRIYNLLLNIYLSTKFHADWPLASMCYIIARFDDVMMTSRHFGFKGLLETLVPIDTKEKKWKNVAACAKYAQMNGNFQKFHDVINIHEMTSQSYEGIFWINLFPT